MKWISLPILMLVASAAEARLCNAFKEKCWLNSGSSSTPAYPSKNSSIRINPSGVPTADAYGAEVIYFGGQFDVGLVKGTGRIGAAVSASNGEETFFGPRALEYDSDYLERKRLRKPYASQKVGLAGAVNIFDNKRDGLNRLNLSFGASAKYNRITKSILPGGGLSVILGPFSLGYALANDETEIEQTYMTIVKSNNQTVSVGIFLNSFALDYSLLTQAVENTAPAKTTLITASLFLQRWIVTASQRSEDSERRLYEYATQSLVQQQIKKDYFGGVQFSMTKVLLLGVFYNYYQLRDISVGATLFL